MKREDWRRQPPEKKGLARGLRREALRRLIEKTDRPKEKTTEEEEKD